MNNPLRNNSLASGLLGFILGAISFAGGQTLLGEPNDSPPISSFVDVPNGDGIPYNEDGDVLVTPSGARYHNIRGCPSLKRSKNAYLTNREDAEKAGRTPCSKCHP